MRQGAQVLLGATPRLLGTKPPRWGKESPTTRPLSAKAINGQACQTITLNKGLDMSLHVGLTVPMMHNMLRH